MKLFYYLRDIKLLILLPKTNLIF